MLLPANDTKKKEPDNWVNPLIELVDNFKPLDNDTAGDIDLHFRAALAELTKGMSIIELIKTYTDWLGHLSISPGRQLQLLQSLGKKTLKLSMFGLQAMSNTSAQPKPLISDRRFKSESWQNWPFNLISQSWLSTREMLSEMTTDIAGLDKNSEELVAFVNQQILEVFSPTNIPFTNPHIIETTKAQKGENLMRGFAKLAGDIKNGTKEPHLGDFVVGKDLGTSPGKVIYENELIELIQYSPATTEVNAEPILFIPPWIMKFYILDLSPEKSMVKYLVEQGKTVFIISWKNPTIEDRDRSMDDYLNMGVMEAIKAVQTIIPNQKIDAAGYCLGGTILCIAAAKLAQDHNDCLNSITLFAAQADFSEPGEIGYFLSESQVSHLESLMWKKGVMESSQMGGAFSALRPAEQIWGPKIQRYLLGDDTKLNELMAWNADGTRMPYRMHTEYLRQLYLNNDLATGRYEVDGTRIALSDIRCPTFVVGTVTDHVAPWLSVYKLTHLLGSDVTFLLTTGGHNAGIISGPSHPRRSYQVRTQTQEARHMDPDTWVESVEKQDGSWWPEWDSWINSKSSGKKRKASARAGLASKGYKILRDAPGKYVLRS